MKLQSETKVDTKFDAKSVRQILADENKFISEVWPKLGVPESTKNDDSEYLLPKRGSAEKKAKAKTVPVAVDSVITNRAKSLEELHEKLEAMKGKKLGYKEKLVKKGLKNRIKKKEKQKINKPLVKQTKSTDIKPGVKPVRPVFNSEGKMVFSKFDFSESGVKEEKEKHEKKRSWRKSHKRYCKSCRKKLKR